MSDPTDAMTLLPEPLQLPVTLALDEFRRNAGDRAVETLPPDIANSLVRVWAASPFVAGHCARRPALLWDLVDSGRLTRANGEDEYRELLRPVLEAASGEAGLMAALRRFRHREMVRLAWRDIAGWAPLEETLLDVSRLAETCVDESLAFLFRQACAMRGTPLNRHGQPQSLVVLGMGKLGAWELNFSSDIDLIFAYRDDGTLPDKKETSYSEFYTRLARSLVKALDAVTEDGFVFRVDTRLRPFGDSGALALSFDAMEAYYQAQAREWERYAMVKARTIAGDFEAGRELEEFLRPFVYRRYLDYRALGELRDLKQKISLELQRKDRQENVKLGPGGIREIEFIGQAFQLIRGGQDKRLRERRILAVLETLRELRLLPDKDVDTLVRAYRYLRTVENRLQQYADRQTHDLPTSPVERLVIAHALGHADWGAFKWELDTRRARVHGIFQQVIAGAQGEAATPPVLNGDAAQTAAALRAVGWAEPDAAVPVLERFLISRHVRNMTQRGEAELKRLLPMVLRAVAGTGQPLASLERILEIIEAVASRNVYLTLLAENPPALAQLAKLAATSPWISNYIARHPLLLDELMDPRSLYTPLTKLELARELARKLDSVDPKDLEQLMIALRQFKQANVLRVAAADLSEAIPIRVVSDFLTYIAETVVESAMRLAWQTTAEKHGPPPGARFDEPDGFAVIAYGKLGGFELGYGSDLDLVFLYDGVGTAPTTGDKPVTTAEFFSRVGKRIIHILTTNTPAGVLYETDLRLRPSGGSGLLVSSVEAYDTYQMQNAWTWEQQALVKARFIAGDPAVGAKFQAIREKSLRRERDTAALRAEVRDMREKMRESLGSKDPASFALKQDPGGIVDIEFLVQFGVLSGAHTQPNLTEWTDVVRQLDSLTVAGFTGADDAEFLRQTYWALRERTHRASLKEAPATAPADEYLEPRSRVQQIWRDVMER
ncbi:bifunctional [glutamate--ammonia ligase]-adenylyl-L-tyrosine phosphorylase/[glutamate--ammonia-ligase] adenylyltransferase [Methylomagnum sp.]